MHNGRVICIHTTHAHSLDCPVVGPVEDPGGPTVRVHLEHFAPAVI